LIAQAKSLSDIRDLVDRGILIRKPGGGRGTSYRLASPEELEMPGSRGRDDS